MKSKYKYALITSQYYHDYYFRIIEIGEDEQEYTSKMQKFLTELIQYKSPESTDNYLGDFDNEYISDGLRRTHNLNHNGDIYVTHAVYPNGLLYDLLRHERYRHEVAKGRKRNEILKNISERHDHRKIGELIDKYFEVM